MLSKCLQLLENGWVKETEVSVLALFLMADWLVQMDETEDACALPLKCYTLLQETDSLEKLKKITTHNKSEPSDDVEGNADKNKNELDNVDEIQNTDMAANDENDLNLDNETATSKIENTHADASLTSTNTDTPSSTHLQNTWRDWNVAREKCPFCDEDASLQSLKSLTCSNGHAYSRCCLTLRTTTMNGRYRRCVGCGRTASRKCFESELNIDSVLLNIDLCPFCGCRFIEHNR